MTENIALRGDVRYIIPFNGENANTNNNLLYTVGIAFAFGGEKKAAPAVVSARAAEPAAAAPVEVKRDSDGDGVFDDQDKCPGTPAGVSVDEFGCPLDSDRDGVPDYRDKCPGTPAGVKVNTVGCPPPPPPPPQAQKVEPLAASKMERTIQEKGRVTLNVEFDTNKAVVKPKYNEEIGNLADVMKKHPNLKILIEGHTDSTGNAKLNEKLSQRRAEAVQKYLMEKFGIEGARLAAKGYGKSRPAASNATKEGRQKNRRVEAAAEYVTVIKK